ncbi:MAG: hypothetical protein JSW25_08715 [Thermoplasmata archaeon]|nr:MAG: hypothetical protein JSW25_08715 [Thermoplasmata archaeon]
MSLTAVIMMVGAAFLIAVPGPAVAQDNVLKAYWTNLDVTLDGLTDEDAWSTSIPVHTEATRLSPISVEMRALYDDQYIYMAFKWEDLSWSVNPNQWLYTGGEWTPIPNKEDSLSLLWNTDSPIDGFDLNKQGCEAACHNDVFKTSAGEVGDLWQWNAGRTNPSTQVPDVGWMDDASLTDTGIVPDAFTGKVWEMNSVFAHDGNESTEPFTTGDLPKWMEGNPPPNPDPEGNFLFRGFEVDIEDHNAFDDGAALPGFRLSKPPAGQDRSDISAKGVYDGTKHIWSVEVRRELDTGNSGDVIFDDLLEEYEFGLAVFDNQGGGKDTHYKTELITLGFELPELAVLDAMAEPTSPIIGDTVNVSMTVKNMGEWTDDFTVAMYLDNTTTEPLSTKPFTEMGNGGEETFNFTWDTSDAPIGMNTLIIMADSDEIVLEKDEEDNVAELEIWVYPPISKFKANNKEPEEGTKVKLTATVDNPSDEDITVTVILLKDEEELETQIVNVTAGGSTDVVFKWEAKKEGKHTFAVKLQGSDETLMEATVDVKSASPGPGLILAVLAIGLMAAVVASSRRRRT